MIDERLLCRTEVTLKFQQNSTFLQLIFGLPLLKIFCSVVVERAQSGKEEYD